MHVIFHFPVIDLRLLVPDLNGRLEKPQWPYPSESKKPFIRNFGKVKLRKLGGSKNFIGESHFCDLKSIIKLKNLDKKSFSIDSEKSSAIVNSSRRFFSDGWFTGKIEIGLADNLEKNLSNTGMEKSVSISEILNHYSQVKIEINGIDVDLFKAGPKLAKLYQEKSTYSKKIPFIDYDLVENGEPAIVLTYHDLDSLALPKYSFLLKKFKLSDETKGLELYGYKLKLDGYHIKVYIIKSPFDFYCQNQETKTIIRNLRINLLGVHGEKETIRILLNALKNKKIDPKENREVVNTINQYFKITGEKLYRKKRYSLEQEDFIDYALQSEERLSPGMFKFLEEKTKLFQDKFLASNITRAIEKMEKKVILFVCTNPQDKNFTQFDKEFQNIKENLREGIDRDNYDLEIESSVLKEDFADILDRYRPQYLHLSLHGTEEEGLYFEDQNRRFSPMSIGEFKDIIKRYSEEYKLKLVIISACNSQKHAKAVKKLCDFAIGTKALFPVPAALVYSDSFYKTFFNGKDKNVEYCHSGAIQAIKFKNFQKLEIEKKVYPIHEIPILIKNR